MDIQLVVSKVDARRLVDRKPAETSAEIAKRVMSAREIQRRRFAEDEDSHGGKTFCNAAMSNRQVERYCILSSDCKLLLERLIERMGLSARACSRMLKLARTIADLAHEPDILPEHLSEAAGYRFLDRQNIFF